MFPVNEAFRFGKNFENRRLGFPPQRTTHCGMLRANEAFRFGKISEHGKNVQKNAKIYQPRKSPKGFGLRDC